MKKMIKFSKIRFPKMVLFVSIMFFAMILSVPATAEAAATVTIGSQSATNGQNINVPVTATNFANNVGGIDFTIQYDPALLNYTSITQNAISGHGTLTVGTTSNTIIVNWFDNSALSLDSGTILTLNFTVISSSNTTANLSFSGGSLSDGNGDTISPTSFVDGAITLNPVNTPVVTTGAASSITATTATGNGNITSIGGSSPTVRGVAYGLTTAYGATTTEAGSFSTGAFTASMTGLTCNTLYHYMAYAANTSGTSTGSDVTFTTSPCVPTVVTSAASSVTMSTATLNGSISATGGANATQSGFAYGTSASLATTIATSTLGAQTGTASFNEAISGLTPSTTYYFRAYATNSAGTSTGSILSFTTSAPGVPTVTTQSASSITATTATGNGNITSTGGVNATVRGVAYGLTTAYGATTTEAGSFSTGAFTASMTGLTCNTLYHYMAYAANTSGTSTASDSTFTTSPCVQTVVTSAASSITTNTATLNGSISSTGGADATQSGFAYGTSATLATTIATSTLGAQTGTASFNETISGLTPSTTYYFRAYTTNSAGTSYGLPIISFTTSAPGAATVTTQSASSITATTATGNGNITSTGGSNATVRGVAYGLTTAYGATTTENGSFSTGAFTASMTGLACNTLYHYMAYAVNTVGTSTGSDVTFTTSPCAPTVVTSAASSVTMSTVTLNGSISNTGGANATQSGFAYGTSATLATTIATSTLGAQTGTASFTEAITGLTPSTTYYFRAYATNSAGTSYGLPIVSFTTSAPGAPTVTTGAASSITATGATGNGNITSTGGVNATVRGVAYGLTTAYGATTTEAGSFSTGAFTASMTGLTCNTLYHYRAYAANTSGTSTGSDVTFTTSPCVPTVVTSAASSITPVTVTLNGSISSTGGADATQSGFAYGTSATLATTIATSTLGAQTGTASFNETISGLTPSTTYYFRAYATNSAGTSYGSIQNFTTSAPSVPGAPTIGTATAGDTTASVTFTAPLNDGGSTISYYTVISSPSNIKAYGVSSPITVSGLTNGQAYTFTVKATNDVGTSSASAASNSVTPQIPAPTVTISASPTTISSGSASNITWSSTNASTCTTTKAGVDWDYSTSNSVTSGPLTASTIFTITCTGAGGSTSASATVGIASSGGNSSGGGGGYVPFTPTMTITASPTSVASGASSMISWNSSMVGSCFITKAGASWYIGTSTSGSKSSGPITSPTTFSALCGGTFGVAFKNVTVGVIGLTQGLFNTNLSMGMTHPDVARLQQFLNGRGYTVSTTGIGSAGQESNYFGLKTQQALMRFQTDNHIVPPNGKLGPITRTLINSLLGGTTSSVTITPPTTPISTTTTTYVFTRSLTLGATGADVKALQVYLNSHGSPVATSGPGSIGNESNYFGMATKNALAKFQKAHSIEPAEGYFGQITRTFINNN